MRLTFENLTTLRCLFFLTSVMDQIRLHWELANVRMPQKLCAEAEKTLNLSKCENQLPTHKAVHHPGQGRQRLRHVARGAGSLFHPLT